MKYRTRMDLVFDTVKDRDEAVNLMKPYLAKAKDINVGASNEEKSNINHHKCLHDEGGSCIENVTLYIDDVKEAVPKEL